MSFLAPLFVLGAAAVALPVLFHLIRRSSRERIPFSSLMFLMPTPPRVTRRSKLENVFLLLLRCLVICFLAFAFARPFFSKPVTPDPAGRAGQRILVLLDKSASMRRGSLWTEAKEKAKATFRNASLADQLAFVTFDREVRSQMSFEQWSALPASDRAALACKQVDELTPSWTSTRLGGALINACEIFEASSKEEQSARRIVLITDLQEGSHLDGLQGFEWPKGIEVDVEVVKPGQTSNAGLQLAPEQVETPGAEPAVRVRVSNAPDSRKEQFHLGWKSALDTAFIGPTIDTYIPPGQNRVLAVPRPTNGIAADRIVLTGDDEDFDNTVYVVAPKAERTRILYLSDDPEKDPHKSLYYLKRAFQDTRQLAVEVVAADPKTSLAEKDFTDARLVILNGLISEDQARLVRGFLDRGKSVLVTITSSTVGPVLSRLAGAGEVKIDEATGQSYAMLSQIDFQHRLFSPFADPRYSDFTKIHFWKHRQVALDNLPGNRVLARFDDGAPALIEVPAGKGKMWVLTSGWQPEDSQLALSSKFVPLLYAMLEQGDNGKETQTQYAVGDTVALTLDAESVTIRKPDASETKVVRAERFNGADQPGIYSILSAEPKTFAVNLTPEESKTAPMALEELERLGVPLRQQLVASPKQVQLRREHLQAVQLENRQKLWRWLLVAALVVLMMETWLAGRLTRRALAVVPEPQ